MIDFPFQFIKNALERPQLFQLISVHQEGSRQASDVSIHFSSSRRLMAGLSCFNLNQFIKNVPGRPRLFQFISVHQECSGGPQEQWQLFMLNLHLCRPSVVIIKEF